MGLEKQDTHGALNVQLITDLLRVASKKDFKLVFTPSLSQVEGHRGLSRVCLRDGMGSSVDTRLGRGRVGNMCFNEMIFLSTISFMLNYGFIMEIRQQNIDKGQRAMSVRM